MEWYLSLLWFRKLLEDNIATKEVILTLTSEKCIFSICGFQMDKTYSCKVEEKNNDLYLFDANSHEKFGRIIFIPIML